jgi:hypothetical protein
VRISEVRVERSERGTGLSARLGDFTCTFGFPPDTPLNDTGDPFLAAALLAAMARGEPLELDQAFTASPTLLEGLEALQEVFSTWVPELERVPVVARVAPPPSPRGGTGTFFSGGADSLHTLLEKEDEVTHALHIRGFDYRRERHALAAEVDRRNREFLQPRGVELLVVESNLRDLYDRLGVHVYLYHGSHLASVGLALGFEQVYVPSSFTWTGLLPWGSHPVTDPLWGNGATRFVQHGLDAGRVDKLRRIGREPDALALLRVCPGFTNYSCGACEKCLRTRVALRLLGMRSPNLEPLVSVWPVARLRIDSERSRVNWSENWLLARDRGDRALSRALGLSLSRYELERGIRRTDEMLLGGRLWRAARRLRGRPSPSAPEIRIDGD